MKDVPRHPRLTRRKGSGNWYFRARVPEDVQDLFGKREVTRSLKTSDHKEALRRVKIASLEFDQEVDEKRREKAAVAVADLSDSEISRLTAIWYHHLLEEDEQDRMAGMDDTAYREVRETLDVVEAGGGYALARGDTSTLSFEIDDFLESHGIALDKDSVAYRRFAYAMLKTWVKAVDSMQQRHSGQVVETPPEPHPFSSQTPLSEHDKDSPTLMAIFEMWATEHIANGGAERTLGDFQAHCRRFTELHGPLPVAAITKAHVRDFKDAMLRYPSRFNNKMKGKTVPQLLEMTEKDASIPVLSPRTVNDKALGAIGAVLGWAEDNDYIPHNPASRVKVKGAKVTSDRRLSYSVDDLNMIFRFPVYTKGERMKGGGGEAAYWLPLLAAFTGARLEELGQLHDEDIKRDRDIDYIDMTTLDDDRRLKTSTSKRRVPIHPELVRLGFLDYVQGVGQGRLFPDLTSKQGKLTASFSQWWGRYARKHGITDRRKVFHSFSHAAKDALREGGVEEQVSDALMGHSPQSEGRKYGSGGIPLTRLAEGIVRLAYPGLEVDHLLRRY